MLAVAPSPHSSRSLTDRVRRVLCLAVTAVCLAMAGVVVFSLRLGAVVATLDASAGRGVHEGDVLALPLVAVAFLFFAAGVRPPMVRPDRSQHPPRSP